MNSREERRQERMNILKEQILRKLGKTEPLKRDWLISYCIATFGVEKRKAIEYVDAWITVLDLVERDGGLHERT